ncbi:116_t:CDS:2, partial [Acaulospora colombiana]
MNESDNDGKIRESFVKISGTGFVLDDKPYYIIGANYWQAMNLGMVIGNRSRVIQDLATLKENGVNCVRIMAGSEGPSGEPQRMYPALMNSPGEYNEDVFEVINRRNTVNGIIYKDDSVIFSWELANEPQDIPKENGHEYMGKWIDSSAGYIKSLDENHLVTSGAEGKHGKEWFITMHRNFTSAHVWVENWGYYKSDDPSIENFQRANSFMLDFLQNVSDWSTSILHKPVLLGEYGMARDAWSGVSKYSPKATTTNRDKYFTAITNKVLELEKQHKFTGHMFWAYAGVAKPSDNYPQWIGDPPHEPPGWYSVYDTDKNTLKVFATHAKE